MGPLLLLRASVSFALVGWRLYTRLLGPRWGRALFWGGMGLSTVVVVALQLSGR